MTVYAITDTKKGRTGIAPTYLHTTPVFLKKLLYVYIYSCYVHKNNPFMPKNRKDYQQHNSNNRMLTSGY